MVELVEKNNSTSEWYPRSLVLCFEMWRPRASHLPMKQICMWWKCLQPHRN